MEVTGINSTNKNNPYELVRILFSKDECPVKDLKSFVLPGIMQYNINKKAYDTFLLDCVRLEIFSTPLQAKANHGEGLSLILEPGAIEDTSAKSPSYLIFYFI